MENNTFVDVVISNMIKIPVHVNELTVCKCFENLSMAVGIGLLFILSCSVKYHVNVSSVQH